MASRRSYKKPLEWQFAYANTTDATVTTKRIELGLKDDEVAEVHKVMSYISPDGLSATTADDIISQTIALSMDPDTSVDPESAANNDDLEWFYLHRHKVQQLLEGASGLQAHKHDNAQDSDFNPPILVGTDIGMVVKNDADISCKSWVRVYFTRRKANVQELNQILLKRR